MAKTPSDEEQMPEETEKKSGVSEQRNFFKQKYQGLQDIPGLGPATIEKLKEYGYHTVEDLAMLSSQDIKDMEGLGESIEKAVLEAKKSIETSFITAAELIDTRQEQVFLSTGCSSLDDLMRIPGNPYGGIPSQSITEFYGEFGSGKSQLCHQICATVQLPKEEGGLDGKALYIDSEGVLLPERMIQIGERFGLSRKEVLNGVITAEAFTSKHQITLVENSGPIMKEENVKLLIVDSLTSHFRSEYIGRESLAPRQQLLNRHMHRLLKIARGYNIPVVVTNQVTATPDAWASRVPKAIGGNIVGHMAHSRIFIRKGRNTQRVMKIIASPFLPEGEAPMYLNQYGLVSAEQMEKIESQSEE